MQSNPKKHWRSLAELDGTPEFKEKLAREFPSLDPTADIGEMDGVTRRRFLQVMGASMALAGASSCRWETEEILSLADRPANRIPGKSLRYASALEMGGHGFGVSLTSYDGRPVKVEGNENDPISGGATDVFAQNAILELYDPCRSRSVTESGIETTFDAFDAFWNHHLSTKVLPAKGKGLAFLSSANSSPTIAALKARMAKELKGAVWAEYEAVSRDNEVEGSRTAFGKAQRTHYNLSAARVVVSLDGDLFSSHPAELKHNRDWALVRQPKEGAMGRLYAAESRHSTDGAMADHRVPMRSSDVPVFLALIESLLASDHSLGLEGGVRVNDVPDAHAATDATARKVAKAIAQDLAGNTGRSILVAGPNQSAEVHARIHSLNELLGNVGRTVTYTNEPAGEHLSHTDGLATLVASMKSGAVHTLVIIGGNAAYDAPSALDFKGALAKVGTTVRLGLYADETSLLCDWHLPQAHALEAWSDAMSWDGAHLIGQPAIAPIWGARSVIEFLAATLPKVTETADQLVRAATGLEGKAWRKAVHDGVASESILKASKSKAKNAKGFRPAAGDKGVEVTFAPDTKVWDGRFANSSWLQELPDFMSKLTWDNVAMVSKTNADAWSVTTGDMLQVTVDGQALDLPVYVMPGQAVDSVALALGYGRTRAGVVGGMDHDGVAEDKRVAPVGVDVYPLRKAGVFTTAAKVKKIAGTYPLAMTQEHHLMDEIGMRGSAERLGVLVREQNLGDFDGHDKDHFRHAVHHPKLESLWTERTYEGYAWGMSLDLSVCNGCNACVIACQSENNIPVVGKSQVISGREMHWLRLDRYFAGPAEAPEVSTLPVNCQQCELAPCEQVCPVAATTHSDDGLNDMVYNRCVGTRYCANNCPFKVRRFNYLNFRQDLKDPNNEVAKLTLNPAVTVRSRGVMEKCTYCVQRIAEAKIDAKNEGRKVRDGEITTACAQVCSTSAIVFGDKGDPDSRVSKLHEDPRAYELLAELNLKPRNNFLAKIRNPHSDLAHAEPSDAHAASNGGH